MDNEGYCWGAGSYGQIGNNENGFGGIGWNHNIHAIEPTKVHGNHRFKQISLGN